MNSVTRRREAPVEVRTSRHVTQDLAAAQDVLRRREADVRDAAASYEAALDLGREAALEARQRLAEAEVDRDVARRAAVKLETEHGLALEGERRAALAGVVGPADAAIATYRAAVEQFLPEMARMARQLAEAWAAAEEANDEAEAALQKALRAQGVKNAGRQRPSVEAFRTWAGRPRDTVGEPEEHELWTNAQGEAPGDKWQARIRLQPDGTGVLNDGGPIRFTHKRRFRIENVIEAQRACGMPALVKDMRIPGLTVADSPGWDPVNSAEASKVRERLAELERPRDIADDRRWPKPSIVPVGPPYEVGRA